MCQPTHYGSCRRRTALANTIHKSGFHFRLACEGTSPASSVLSCKFFAVITLGLTVGRTKCCSEGGISQELRQHTTFCTFILSAPLFTRSTAPKDAVGAVCRLAGPPGAVCRERRRQCVRKRHFILLSGLLMCSHTRSLGSAVDSAATRPRNLLKVVFLPFGNRQYKEVRRLLQGTREVEPAAQPQQLIIVPAPAAPNSCSAFSDALLRATRGSVLCTSQYITYNVTKSECCTLQACSRSVDSLKGAHVGSRWLPSHHAWAAKGRTNCRPAQQIAQPGHTRLLHYSSTIIPCARPEDLVL